MLADQRYARYDTDSSIKYQGMVADQRYDTRILHIRGMRRADRRNKLLYSYFTRTLVYSCCIHCQVCKGRQAEQAPLLVLYLYFTRTYSYFTRTLLVLLGMQGQTSGTSSPRGSGRQVGAYYRDYYRDIRVHIQRPTHACNETC